MRKNTKLVALKSSKLKTDPVGGGGTLLYEPYWYVAPQRVGFLRRLDLKTGIDFAYFGLESGMVFKGN